ncbi:FAD-dependent oxidoreductase [Cyanobium sp. N5-Cardenillas]|nr:FAD-dependent oxidoreductase [Cyanobium sp. N5-Cardenillas]
MPPGRFFLELDPPLEAIHGWPHVAIVGGGFAGLKACNALAGKPVRVTLIDTRNFNLLQPLLYQGVSGLVTEAALATACSLSSATLLARALARSMPRRTITVAISPTPDTQGRALQTLIACPPTRAGANQIAITIGATAIAKKNQVSFRIFMSADAGLKR